MLQASSNELAASPLVQGDIEALRTIQGMPVSLDEAKVAIVHLINCRRSHGINTPKCPTLDEALALESQLCQALNSPSHIPAMAPSLASPASSGQSKPNAILRAPSLRSASTTAAPTAPPSNNPSSTVGTRKSSTPTSPQPSATPPKPGPSPSRIRLQQEEEEIKAWLDSTEPSPTDKSPDSSSASVTDGSSLLQDSAGISPTDPRLWSRIPWGRQLKILGTRAKRKLPGWEGSKYDPKLGK